MSLEAMTGAGVVAFWVMLLLRLPGVLRQREFRNMYFSVVTLGLSVTLYYPPVALYLAELFGSARPCNVGMNIWGMLTCGAVLVLVARELLPKAVVYVYVLAAAVMVVIAVMAQTVSQTSVGCATALALPWWDPYWWVICAMWIFATSAGGVLCAKCIKVAAGIPALTVSMVCFLIGFASSAVFWAGIFVYLLARPTWVLTWLPVILCVHIWSYTLGLAIGVGSSLVGWMKTLGTMRGRMWLLRHLDALAAGAGAVGYERDVYRALWRDFAQNQRLGVYRAEVQILDAVSVLGDAGSPTGARLAALTHSPEGLDASGEIDFDKLERYVRELNQEAKSDGSVQNG
ncbi:hypothetical protein [Mycobacteroides salmoniphilum]|uniref:Uncharacterized protein n=1 Tax=Mycobacteroides salmoniphilum TaxID=404941 RepID=A0A4R8T048_9MYCO|nr:hypothetical protein [Mycobacteroides salmoniphilum]TEA09191.1 hypothetical protein CCUG60884_00181 [Mycobacteroides salmoniphilum]